MAQMGDMLKGVEENGDLQVIAELPQQWQCTPLKGLNRAELDGVLVG